MNVEWTETENEVKETPLAMALANAAKPQVTPLDAFKLARKHWLEGRRISICDLAKELGVSRGKLYRWVGNKEMLLDEIIWSVAKPTFERAIEETPGVGVDHVVEVHRNFMVSILSFPPLQKFVSLDPPYALRILSKEAKSAHERLIKMTAAHLQTQEKRGFMQLPASPETLAEMMIRTNESLIYHDIISGRSPAVDQACTMSRLLLSAAEIPDLVASTNS